MIGEIKVGFRPQTRIIMDDTGIMITEGKQIINHFKKHFECLLNRPVGHDLDLNSDYYQGRTVTKKVTGV